MGQEIDCTVRYQRRSLAGKAYLETDFVLFRGPERLKIPFKDLKAVRAAAGVLHLDFAGGPAEFELGKAAEKWAQKILHPPTRADKLGVKSGLTYRLEGSFDDQFVEELRAGGSSPVGSRTKPDLVFYLCSAAEDLTKVAKLSKSMRPDGALWVVYPKGIPAIREIEVLDAGRAAGLKDVKVASFSATLTALKFVVPVANR